MKHKHKQAYMECAQAFAKCSAGNRLKVGSVLVKNNRIISCGYNALPEHMHGNLEDENGVTKPEVRHSEKNALMGLVRSSENAIGATMFCTHSCCRLCAVDIVDSGIIKFIYKEEYRCTDGIEYLRNNGVEVEKFEDSQDKDIVAEGFTDSDIDRLLSIDTRAKAYAAGVLEEWHYPD